MSDTERINDDLAVYGPLAGLIGIWEGKKGDDIAPSDDRGIENNKFRERMVFEPIGLVENHEQKLYGLRYSTMAWRLGAENSFHEELGYWLWDSETQEVMRCFLVPRGVSLIAGGKAKPNAKEFKLQATLGSPTYGICSNPFLDREFKTVKYDLVVKVDGDNLSYDEDTQMEMKGQKKIFHHTDKNTLVRIGR